jgi:formiminoglutamase
MPSFVRPEVVLPPAAPGDARVGHLLSRHLAPGQAPRAVLLGFPVDEGVRRNGGRAGAAHGPAAIRRALYRMTPDAWGLEAHAGILGATLDAGDLVPSGELEADQEALGEAVAGWLERGAFPVVLGGGHETAYGHFLGYARLGRPVEILNLDAHPDVREPVEGRGHSGSPFRQALTHPSGACRRYRVAGIEPQSAARDHLAWLEACGGRAFPAAGLDAGRLEELFGGLGAPAIATFDLDALDQAHAPGVSAPAAAGLLPGPWLAAAFLAGRTEAVSSADVCELCPPQDPDGRTARLAALTVWEMLRGLAARGGPGAPAPGARRP